MEFRELNDREWELIRFLLPSRVGLVDLGTIIR